MTWRTATDADFPALRRMMHALYVEDPSTVAMTDAKIDRTLAMLTREPVRGVAVVLDHREGAGPLEGYALLCSFWSNELGGEVCVLDELYVGASARGRGAATALVSGLRARTTPWFRDAVAIELEVTPNNTRARALYERLGFAPLKNAVMRAVL
jgi:GNAT superfamily N-acetyltransferase